MLDVARLRIGTTNLLLILRQGRCRTTYGLRVVNCDKAWRMGMCAAPKVNQGKRKPRLVSEAGFCR
jgi:hypothetical protein